MNETACNSTHTEQIPIANLPGLHHALHQTLTEDGLAEPEATAILSQCAVAQCVLCGLKFTGAELATLEAASPSPEASVNPKFARVRLGYCGRDGCDSRFYTLVLADCPAVDWPPIIQRLGNFASATLSTDAASVSETAPSRPRLVPPKLLLKLSLAVGVILLLLFARYVMNGGRIPLLQPPHHYAIDPASVRDTSGK